MSLTSPALCHKREEEERDAQRKTELKTRRTNTQMTRMTKQNRSKRIIRSRRLGGEERRTEEGNETIMKGKEERGKEMGDKKRAEGGQRGGE